MSIEIRSEVDEAWYVGTIKRKPTKDGIRLQATFDGFPDEGEVLTAEDVDKRVRFESTQLQVCPQ
eukprot:1192152-Prorocentrum_minimum.AAC.4